MPAFDLLQRARAQLVAIADATHTGIAEASQLVHEIDDCLRFKATPEEVERARDKYALGSSDNIEIDDDAQTSPTDDGTWVQAWVWLANEPGKG
jgi:hypothetical protein